MDFNKFSLVSFIIGLLVGVIVTSVSVGVIALSFYQSIVSETTYTQGGIVSYIAESIREGAVEQESTSIYGKLKGVNDGLLTLEASRMSGKQTFIFRYDETTQFVRLRHDDDSTEVTIQPEELAVNEYVTVTLDAPLGNGKGRHVTKVVKF